ncbi:MAG: hypothetical protein AMXMBFR82_35400 [Candidatus Hydrogenedentota bacterium]
MTDASPSQKLHARYEWLDQSRGIVSIMYIFAIITYRVSGDPILGYPQLGPTFLNHGYKYYQGATPLITIIDVGQQIFMFVMGFVAYLAFTSRIEKRGSFSAALYGARRVVLLFALSGLEAVVEYPTRHSIDWVEVFYEGTLAKLAIGAFAAYLTMTLIRNANHRFLFGLTMLAAHAVLHASPFFHHYGFLDGPLNLLPFPFGAMGLAAIAVIATCFAQWVWTHPDGFAAAFRTRVATASFYTLGACYCLDWLQPAHHHDVTASLALFAVGISGLMLTMTFGFDSLGIHFPLLSSLGRNLLLVFVLASIVVDKYLGMLDRDFLNASPYWTLLLVGVLPIAFLGVITIFLDRKRILIKV